MRIDRSRLLQFCITIFNIVFTIILPIINYIGFKNSLSNIECESCPDLNKNQINLGTFEMGYDVFIYINVILGILITSCSFLIFRFQTYSVQKGFLSFSITFLYVIFFAFTSQLSIIFITVSNIQLKIDFSSIYIIFIIAFSVYGLKNIFDIVDFKINQAHYTTILRKRRFIQKKLHQKLVNCTRCDYSFQVNVRSARQKS
jgi:hypothetical protein